MKNHYEINTEELSSCTVDREEITAVEIEPGEQIFVRRKPVSFDQRVVCVVDRFDWRDRTCTMIRQVLECPDESWGQECIHPNRSVRSWARRNGFPTVTVPGGIRPLVREGTIAVPDFNMSGTTWFLVPETALAASGIDFKYRED